MQSHTELTEHVIALNESLVQQEKHFNVIQHHYRLLASAWMLAMLSGVGYVFGLENPPLGVHMMTTMIGIAGAFGISLLWALDLRVYHQLLDACLVEGLRLEEQFPSLPQVRTNMLATQNAKGKPNPLGVLSIVIIFYVAGLSLAFACSFAGWPLQFSSDVGILAVVGAVHAAVCLAWIYLIRRATRSPLLEIHLEAKAAPKGTVGSGSA